MKVHTLFLLLAILAALSCTLVSSMDGDSAGEPPQLLTLEEAVAAAQKASGEANDEYSIAATVAVAIDGHKRVEWILKRVKGISTGIIRDHMERLVKVIVDAAKVTESAVTAIEKAAAVASRAATDAEASGTEANKVDYYSAAIDTRNRAKEQADVVKAQLDIAEAVLVAAMAEDEAEVAKDDFKARAVADVVAGVVRVIAKYHNQHPADAPVASLAADIKDKAEKYAKAARGYLNATRFHADVARYYVGVLNDPTAVDGRSAAEGLVTKAKREAEAAPRVLNRAWKSFFNSMKPIEEGFYSDISKKHCVESVIYDVAEARKRRGDIKALIKDNPHLSFEDLSVVIGRVDVVIAGFGNVVITDIDDVETLIKNYKTSDARNDAISARSAHLRALDALIRVFDAEARKALKAAKDDHKDVCEIKEKVGKIATRIASGHMKRLLDTVVDAAKATKSAVTAVEKAAAEAAVATSGAAVEASSAEANKDNLDSAKDAMYRAKEQAGVVKAQLDIAEAALVAAVTEAAKDGDLKARAAKDVAVGVISAIEDHNQFPDDASAADIKDKAEKYAKAARDCLNATRFHADVARYYVGVLNDPTAVDDRSAAEDLVTKAKREAEAAFEVLDGARTSFFGCMDIIEGSLYSEVKRYYARSVQDDVVAAKKHLDEINALIKGNPGLRSEHLSATIDKINAVITGLENVETPIEDLPTSDARDCAILARSARLRALDALCRLRSNCVSLRARISRSVKSAIS